jgi:hypothetical protein
MNCPNCKNPIQSNDIDCQWCGAKLNNVYASTSQISHELTDNPSGNTVRDSSLLGNINFQTLLKSKNLKWVGIIILGLAFIIIVVSNISSSSENSYRINSDDYESSYEENEDQVLSEDIIPESEKTETEDIIIDNEHQQSSERSYYQEPLEVIEEQPQISRNRLEIGDYHEGGIIFYLDYSGQHGKVVASEDFGKFDWDEADRFCENLELNNYYDWHLATKTELEMMYDKLDSDMFENGDYWSSTLDDYSGAWWFNFADGHGEYDKGMIDPSYVCAVRAF